MSKYNLYRIAGIEFDVWEKMRLSEVAIEKGNPDFQAIFDAKKLENYAFLQALSQHKSLSTSLPFSSLVFERILKKWQQVSLADFKKKERKTMHSALKYLSRIAAKTSPFGTFTTLQLESRASKVEHRKSSVEHGQVKRLTPNVKILKAIFNLLKCDDDLKKKLSLQLNPSHVVVKNEVFFIKNIANEETLQVIENDETISSFMELFEKYNTLTYKELVNEIEAYFDEPCEFIDDLLSYGFLTFIKPFEKNENGFAQLLAFLENIENIGEKNDLKNHLQAILKNSIAAKNLDIDVNLLEKHCSNVDFIADLAYFQERKEDCYYLDVASNFQDLPKVHADFQGFYDNAKESIRRLLNIVAPLHYDALQYQFQCFLNEIKEEELSFTAFYYRFFHLFEKKEINAIFEKNRNALLEKLNSELLTWNEDGISFNSKDFEPKNQNLWHIEALIQPFFEREKPKAILNGISVGFGKQLARFLPLFDEKIREEIKENNATFNLLDLDDESFFNGNLRPNLTSFQMKDFNYNELIVKKIGNDFYLQKKGSDDILVPIDLSPEHPSFRSSSYQLLNLFGQKIPNFRIINSLINSLKKTDFFPRITVDNQLVIQRKHWICAITEIPQFYSYKNEQDYFLAINRWRKAKNMPSCVYVSILISTQDDIFNPNAEPQRDDYKPQFIDFQNITLVSLFSKLLKKVPNTLKIEEMLPSEENLLRLDGKKYMVEVVI